MDLDQALPTFIAEARELLTEMEDALLAIEQTEDKTELVNAIFRAAHTIKGSSGMFGLDHIVAFTHLLEGVLDQVRDGRLIIADGLVSLLLACGDHIGQLIDALGAGADGDSPALRAQGAPLVAQLRAQLAPSMPAPASPFAHGAQAGPAPALPGAADGHADHWHLSLRFSADVLRDGMDPLSFIAYLGTLGTIVDIATVSDALPRAPEMDPEACYLGFEIALLSACDKTEIEGAFDFVRESSQIRILPPRSRLDDYARLIGALPEQAVRIGEMLVRCGSITERERDAALAAQAERPTEALGALLVAGQAVQGELVEAALAKQQQLKDAHAQESRSVRVDADKLDQLIDLVGELIIAGAGAGLVARTAGHAELQECISKVAGLVEGVRDRALQLRMVKIGPSFNRFQRVVHDVARDIGKDIGLVLEGEETELDKTVIEKITDPLTHLVRNAMDHGIEAAALRRERGKRERGTVRLAACHDAGSIVISVSDDGGGLPRAKILAKAIERGLVAPDQALTDEDIFKLIFEPGFSTADQVSNLSGRGVGLDVVKRNITALRGSVGVASVEGVGTTVTVRLPLTLAIIDGFLVGVGKAVFVIPLDMIEECLAYTGEPDRDYTELRGQVLPLIRLRALLGIGGAPTRRENIVVLKHAGRKAGLVVDSLLGEFQTVIKPLGKIFNDVKCVSGSTILGNGEVALILEVPALVRQAAQRAERGGQRERSALPA